MNAQTLLRRPSPRAVVASALIALYAATPLAAIANPPIPQTATLRSKVSLSDLDLSTPQGMRTAQKRLRKKAEHLCRELGDGVRASYRWTYAACVKETLADAMQQLNATALAANERPPVKP